MRLLYWNTPVYGRLRGTVQCLDGHVILSDVPVADREACETLIREFGDSCQSLPPLRAAVGEALEARGWTLDRSQAPHVVYSPARKEPEGAKPTRDPAKATAKGVGKTRVKG